MADDLFDTCLTFTLAQEGGYVDDPADPGGATNRGITLATLQHWDHEPSLGPADVQDMSQQTAAAIYRTLYWNALRGDSLPPGVDLSTFDFAVNAGTRRSAELLQQVLGLPPDQMDGAVGTGHRLLAVVQPDDGQPRVSERPPAIARRPATRTVRSAMLQASESRIAPFGQQPAAGHGGEDSAHSRCPWRSGGNDASSAIRRKLLKVTGRLTRSEVSPVCRCYSPVTAPAM